MGRRSFFGRVSALALLLATPGAVAAPYAHLSYEELQSLLLARSDGQVDCTDLLAEMMKRLREGGGDTLHLPAGNYGMRRVL